MDNRDYDQNDPIQEARFKYFQDLDQTQNLPDLEEITYEEEVPVGSEPEDRFYTEYVEPPKPEPTYSAPQPAAAAAPKQKSSFVPALIGAVVGGLLVGILLMVFFYFSGIGTGSTYNESSGATINYTGGEVESSVEAVAQVVPQSVVGIYVTGTQTASTIFGEQLQEYSSVGSGFFVTENGYIVTNQHVITDNPETITISTADGVETEAELIWDDANLDVAVIKADISGVQPLSLGDSDDLKVGQTVVAIGNPLGLAYSRSVTSGIISAIDRTLVVDNTLIAEGLIQTDAAINSGNSGGPLVNIQGQVIGINTYKQTQGEGMGFAIPINLFKPIIKQVVETGTFRAVTIGITGYDPEQAKYMTNGEIQNFTSGIYVASVTPDSPAARAGLQPGDIITTVDGKDVNTMIQLRTILYNHSSGDSVTITYTRNGQEYSTDLTL